MRVDTLCEPMADGTQLRDALETAKGLFDEILVEVQREHFVLGEQAGAEDAGVTIEFFGPANLTGSKWPRESKNGCNAGLMRLPWASSCWACKTSSRRDSRVSRCWRSFKQRASLRRTPSNW